MLNKSFVRTAMTIFMTFPLAFTVYAQAINDNLSFEKYDRQQHTFSDWFMSSKKEGHYRIETDSSTAKEGRQSLHMAYSSQDSGLQDGQLVTNIYIDAPCRQVTVSFYAKRTGRASTSQISFSAAQDLALKNKIVKTITIETSADWQYYSADIDVSRLTFPWATLLTQISYEGEGSLWVDDLRVLADGKPLSATTGFGAPGPVPAQPLTTQQISYLGLLGQTWGYLKYYHPAVANGSMNWDMELFRMIPLVKHADNDEVFSHFLLQWIDSLGPVKACRSCTADPSKEAITYNIDLAWMKDKHLSASLQQKLHYLLVNRNQDGGRFAYFKNGTLRFDGEYLYKWRYMNYPHEHFRLLALFRYWNTIQYFFPYKNIINRNWNEALYEFIPRMVQVSDSLNYNKALVQLITSVQDSHASSYNRILKNEYPLYLPVRTVFAGEELVVKGRFNDSLAALSGLADGDVIEQIGTHSVKELIDQWGPFAGGSNRASMLRNLQYQNAIAGGKDSMVTMVIRRGQSRSTKTIRRYRFEDFHVTYKQGNTYWKKLPGDIGYVDMGILEQKHVTDMMKDLKDTRAIIFDVRNYPNSTIDAISQYLHSSETPFAKLCFPDITYPGAFAWGKKYNTCGPKSSDMAPLYTGKIVILVNEVSQSHAEWTAMTLQSVPGSYTIGSTTAGADGNVSMITLPGNYTSMMTGLGVFYPDGRQTQRVGVKVDKVVVPTPQGIAAGRDELVEAALLYLQ